MKRTVPFLALLALPIFFSLELIGCGEGEKAGPAVNAAPANEYDVLLNDYEKAANQYMRLGRKLKGGDVSVTVIYMEAEKAMKADEAKLEAASARLTPAQKQRLAEVKTKVAAYRS